MPRDIENDPRRPDAAARLSDTEVRRVLARASERDAAWSAGVSAADLRTAAVEAGISAEAFDVAVAEVASARARPGRPGDGSGVRRWPVAAIVALAASLGVGGTMVARHHGAATAAAPAFAQASESSGACTPAGVPAERLRALALRLEPQAFAPANRAGGMVVGLMFDAQCALTAHTVSRRAGDGLHVGTTLARLFPRAYHGAFRVAGIAEAGPAPGGPGSPWIVWGVLPAE